MTAPFGGPVVPEVKITTPAALSSMYRSEQMYMSAEERGGAPIDGLIDTHLNSLLVVRLICL
jgi:hypothetical protein